MDNDLGLIRAVTMLRNLAKELKRKPKWYLLVFTSIIILVISSMAIVGEFLHFWGNDNMFVAVWSLDELQAYFTGSVPDSAVNIDYQSAPIYGLLTFDAPPDSATEFAHRFCSGLLYQGYDPFNAQDNVSQNTGYLIKTDRDYFYYSASTNTPQTVFGNRCFEYSRGGVNQILLDKADPNVYTVKLEISAGCDNPEAPHPCAGQYVRYEAHQGLTVNAEPQPVAARYAEGGSWRVSVRPNVKYEVVVKPADNNTVNTSSSYLSIMTLPVISTGNEPYCELCWADTRGAITPEGFSATFVGSPTGVSEIRLFWMDKAEGAFLLQVHEN